MNRTNNYGSRRNVYSRTVPTNTYKEDKPSVSYRNTPAHSSYTKQTPAHTSYTSSTSYSSGGMGGVDIPQAFVDDETGHNVGMRRNAAAARSKGSGGRSWIFSFGILMIFVLVAGYSLVSFHERKLMKNQLAEQDATMRELEIDLSMKFDSKVKELKEENSSLQRKLSGEKDLKILNQNLRDEKKSLDKRNKNAIEEIKSYRRNNDSLSKSKTKLQSNIQRMSREAVLAKFGPGPHRLEMHLRFDSHLGRNDEGTVTIEMAPLDELPHAVHWFLEQASRNLYDGFSFHRNAGHVVQGGAKKNFLTQKHPPSEKKFRDAGYHSLLFQEYSDKFPHKKYTLGFAGRPGGPEIYINTKDNIKLHGPGGQHNYDDPLEADTCFAKVVDGFDLVDRMHNLPVKEGSYKALKDNVAIVRIQLVTKK